MVYANDYKLIYVKDGYFYASKKNYVTAEDTKLGAVADIKGKDLRNYKGGIYELTKTGLVKVDVSAVLVGGVETEHVGEVPENAPEHDPVDTDHDDKCDVCDTATKTSRKKTTKKTTEEVATTPAAPAEPTETDGGEEGVGGEE